jgi:Reverse transcriptase (RNA-dependent DNA polymerase)
VVASCFPAHFQQYGLDYEETFAPVVRFTSIRILLALVAHLNLELHQMDVVTAFLNGDLDDAFLRDGLGLTRNAADDCLYVRIEGGATFLIALYVNDLLIACGGIAYMAEIKAALSQRFEMKDLGEAKMCLGLEISRNRKDGVLTLSQAKYISSVLSRYGMDGAYGAHTPMEAGVDLTCMVRVSLRMTCRTVRRLEA